MVSGSNIFFEHEIIVLQTLFFFNLCSQKLANQVHAKVSN